MGRVTRRLKMLEEHSRGQATAEFRRTWDRLTDEEMAVLLAPPYFGREPTVEEAVAEEAFLEVVPEYLIAWAIGYSEDLSKDEVRRRLGSLFAPVIERRSSGILAWLRTMERARGVV